jgi:hypothetical protein
MNIGRKVGIALAAMAVSFGLLGFAAPAEADTSWGGFTSQIQKR